MVKPKLTLFQMEIKSVFLHASKANQAGFGIGPKAFYAVDLAMRIRKLILTMLYPVMLLIAKVYQSIVATPSVRMDDAFRVYPSTDDALQRSPRAIRNDFRVDSPMPFEEAENESFSTRASASDTSDPARSKVTFINLNFSGKRRSASQAKAIRSRIPWNNLFTVFRLSPVTWAICVAFKSTQKSLTSWRNFASEIFERRTYLFFIVMISF